MTVSNARRCARALAAAASAGLLALLAAGCGTSSKSTPSAGQIEAALAQHGISVCASTTASSHFHGAGTAHWYALSKNCQAAQQATVLAVIPFHYTSDRDAAYIQALYRTRFITDNIAAFRFGDSVVLVTHIRNRTVAQQAIGKLKDLGAR